MTLLELQKILGERIAIATNGDLSDEEKRAENETSDIVCKLAKQMINNADIVLRTDKLISEGKLGNSNIEKMVGGYGEEKSQ